MDWSYLPDRYFQCRQSRGEVILGRKEIDKRRLEVNEAVVRVVLDEGQHQPLQKTS